VTRAPRVKHRQRWTQGAGLLAGVLLLLGLTGCHQLGYYRQAIHGQCQIVHRQRPIADLLADPDTPAPLQEKLTLVLRIREFAERELKLRCNGHYLKYADLGRPFVVWNVNASPEFSMTAKKWWYPLVGRLEYQGYFDETRARRYAQQLRKDGWDVHVGGVTAYSTLGWFHDPVLNTFVFDEEADLAETLFHELAHQRVFVAGDTEFNEAFATVVAEEGLRRWMRSVETPAAYERYRAMLGRRECFVRLVGSARERLEALYAATNVNPAATAAGGAGLTGCRANKQLVLEGLRRDYEEAKAAWGGDNEYDAWFQQPLNNAQLNTVAAYYKLVPGFQQLLRAQGGNLEDFYREVRGIGALKQEDRRHRLASEAVGRREDVTVTSP